MYRAYQALDTIATYKTNTIRVVWETTGGSATLLARILRRIVELKMVPMVELHDVTGGTSSADLQRMATYYTQADIKQVLIDYRGYLLINIANEWSGTGARSRARIKAPSRRSARPASSTRWLSTAPATARTPTASSTPRARSRPPTRSTTYFSACTCTSLTASWGRGVMVDQAASIQKTAAKASIFP